MDATELGITGIVGAAVAVVADRRRVDRRALARPAAAGVAGGAGVAIIATERIGNV